MTTDNLQPFDRVLVRNSDDETWKIDFFDAQQIDDKYLCLKSVWNQCIPYKQNESFLHTTRKPYKNSVFKKGQPVGILSDEFNEWVICLYEFFNECTGKHSGKSFKNSCIFIRGYKCLPASELWPEQ